jgi:acetyl-CoA carboxylase carboxyltransferase component
MLEMLDKVEELHVEASKGGGKEAIDRLRSRNKLPIRERISLVLDRDSPFFEISPLAAYNSGVTIGSGFVIGIGVISETECLILGHDPSVRAGAFNAFNGKKLNRGLQISRENRMPYVQFVESAGADLRGNPGGGGGGKPPPVRAGTGHLAESGRLFYEITELSKMRIPTISVVFGSSTAGGAYQPGMIDYNIFIKKQSKVFLGGPPLVKMATGEDADDESLGGAEMHTQISGLGDYLAEDEHDGIRMCRGSDFSPQLAQVGSGTITAAG